MNKNIIRTKNKFSSIGYEESWNYYTDRDRDDMISLTESFSGDVCLDIGCGSGYFSNIFSKKFNTVYALDINPKFSNFRDSPNINYITTDGCYCKDVCDDSIDLCFSFGLFIHLTDSNKLDYLRDIYRVVKNNGKVCLTFVNYENHPQFNITDGYIKKFHIHEDYKSKSIEHMKMVGFTDITDAIPTFRDSVLLATKRS